MQLNISQKLNSMRELLELIGIQDIKKEEKKEEEQADNREEMILEQKKIYKGLEKEFNIKIDRMITMIEWKKELDVIKTKETDKSMKEGKDRIGMIEMIDMIGIETKKDIREGNTL